ncbi:MAG: metallophosphatase [Chitinophagaceae bacterium]|nr:metallophosphoesterase [Chitinophagaceae bacterium]MCZ2299882.1 metallophosphoesterase [Chitinophagales bacterium]
MHRRKFLKETAYTGGALIASSLLPFNNLYAALTEDEKKLTILHTNDVHSRLEPFPMDGSKNAGLGGVAARAALINDIRTKNENVLLVDAGDIFQGTPYFNLYKGEPEIKAMSLMKYDAATLGNHDFDAGLENLATQLQYANFPIVVCNYDFTNTPMEGKTIPYTIIHKGKIKIGIIGVGIEGKGLIPDNLFGKTVYKNPIENANMYANKLKKEGCDIIVCLSHLGDKYSDDKVSDEILAKENYDIDFIVSGHTHKFFDEPLQYTNKNGKITLVNQVGWAGIQLGRLDYIFSRTRKKNLVNSETVVIGRNISE